LRADGVLFARQPGSTRISAEAGGKKIYTYLTVYPLGSNGLLLELRPSEDQWGHPRVAIDIETTTWTDTDGTTYQALKIVMGGTLNIGRGISGYEQRLDNSKR
jgi:hypothetical protein